MNSRQGFLIVLPKVVVVVNVIIRRRSFLLSVLFGRHGSTRNSLDAQFCSFVESRQNRRQSEVCSDETSISVLDHKADSSVIYIVLCLLDLPVKNAAPLFSVAFRFHVCC
jgi:hypothetical protein